MRHNFFKVKINLDKTNLAAQIDDAVKRTKIISVYLILYKCCWVHILNLDDKIFT